jgi:hypothetical protein
MDQTFVCGAAKNTFKNQIGKENAVHGITSGLSLIIGLANYTNC